MYENCNMQLNSNVIAAAQLTTVVLSVNTGGRGIVKCTKCKADKKSGSSFSPCIRSVEIGRAKVVGRITSRGEQDVTNAHPVGKAQ